MEERNGSSRVLLFLKSKGKKQNERVKHDKNEQNGLFTNEMKKVERSLLNLPKIDLCCLLLIV